MISVDYQIPQRGLGTDFTESERPLSYAKAFTNRFININGGAERRLGMQRVGSQITGKPTLTRLHEYVDNQGTETLFSSSNGSLFRYNVSGDNWDMVLGGKADARMLSVQMGNKLIFVNGTDRNFYTDDGGNTFRELEALISVGKVDTSGSSVILVDSNITNWLTQTQVATNDIVFYPRVSAYGLITAVTSASLTTTVVGVSGTGAGAAVSAPQVGDVYRLVDYVALNIIPVDVGFDNVAVAGPGTSAAVIAVSGVNFANTEIVNGDFVRNTTRNAVTKVLAVSARLNVQPVSAQVAGDSLVFLKSAMPIATFPHVSYGRLYLVDKRDQTKVRISAPDDPQDFTTFAKTLDSSSYNFGTIQPQGDIILAMDTFQKYFIAAGRRNVYIYTGIDPVADAANSLVSFSPVAALPNGCVSRFGLVDTGNDLLYVSPDGLQGAAVGSDSNNFLQSNVSNPVKNDLRRRISAESSDNVQASFYPRRNWLIVKIGDNVFNFNNTPVIGEGGEQISNGSWSLFDGKFAQQNHYYVRRNGDLYACGAQGNVYILDQSGVFTDDGDIVSTQMEGPWMRLEEPSRSVRVKDTKYIKPIFESGGDVVYTINGIAGWDALSTDTAICTAGGGGTIGNYTVGEDAIGGTGVQTDKYGMRLRGEQAKFTFETNTSAGPDIISGMTVYGNIYGRR